MKWLVLIFFVAALLADVYIYRSVICLRFRRLPARISYIVFAAVTDGLALSALLLYGFPSLFGSGILVVMWLVWIFFVVAIPKLLYLAGGFLDFLVEMVSRRRVIVFRVLSTVISVALVVAMVCGATEGRHRFRIVEVEISSPRVPAAFDGYRMVQVSDIHVGTMARPEKRIARLADRIAGLAPDLVVNTGDLVNISARELTPEVCTALSDIVAPDGVWSVWGNHDLGFYMKGADSTAVFRNHAELAARVAGAGWSTLSDRSVYIHRGGDSILLSGIDYPTMKLNAHNNILGGADIDSTFAGIEGDPYNIVLEHTPLLWHEITSKGRGDLTLSGHTHAMQLKLNIFGCKWSPAQYMYEEWSGKYIENNDENRILYVNDGIGCVGYPMRLGVRPEVTLFIFKRCE